MPTQTPVEQVDTFIEKNCNRLVEATMEDGAGEESVEPEKVFKDTFARYFCNQLLYCFLQFHKSILKDQRLFYRSYGVSTQYDETVIENVEFINLQTLCSEVSNSKRI